MQLLVRPWSARIYTKILRGKEHKPSPLAGKLVYLRLRPKVTNMAQLTREQRYTIFVMYEQGFSITEIAKTINKDKSVVSREIKRNSDEKGRYRFTYAQEMADMRKERICQAQRTGQSVENHHLFCAPIRLMGERSNRKHQQTLSAIHSQRRIICRLYRAGNQADTVSSQRQTTKKNQLSITQTNFFPNFAKNPLHLEVESAK